MTHKKTYARLNEPISAASAVQGLVEQHLPDSVFIAKQAAQAWWSANGNIEHKHTCGLYIKDKQSPEEDPTLVVLIDSPSILQDFITNHDLYEDRLAHTGFPVKEVQFKLARDKDNSFSELMSSQTEASNSHTKELPALTKEEEEEVWQSVEELTEPLKTQAAKAIISSLRREKASVLPKN